MNEMCITQRYVIIAYLLADREQRILKSIKYFTEIPDAMLDILCGILYCAC